MIIETIHFPKLSIFCDRFFMMGFLILVKILDEGWFNVQNSWPLRQSFLVVRNVFIAFSSLM